MTPILGIFASSNGASSPTSVDYLVVAGGGGGAGRSSTSGLAGENGATNRGGGGGGAGTTSPYGGNGGSGIVIIRYDSTFADLSSIGGGLTYTKTTSGGKTIYQFTAGTGTVTI